MERSIGFEIQTQWEIKGGLYIAHIVKESDVPLSYDDEVDDSYANTVILCCPSHHVTTDPIPPCTISLVPSQSGPNECLKGISVISEAKYIEVQSDKHGYIGTGKGTKIKSRSGAELYMKDVLFEMPVSDCTIKFLKHENKKQLKIFKIGTRRASSPSTSMGTIDYFKVEELLNDMGQTIPDEAKHMLQSVKNHQESQQGASSMMSPGAGAAGMTGLLAMMSHMSTGGATGFTSQGSQGSPTGGDIINMMQSMMSGQMSDSQATLSSLRNICGAVSKQREHIQSVPQTESPTGEVSGKEGSATQDAVLEVVDKKIAEMETKIMSSVDEKLQGVETRIMSKLDLLLNVLSGTQEKAASSARTGGTGGAGDMALD